MIPRTRLDVTFIRTLPVLFGTMAMHDDDDNDDDAATVFRYREVHGRVR